MDKELKPKRLLKRLRLQAAVEEAEKERHEQIINGFVWIGTTKASLQKQARIGKNYIDLLDPKDDLVKRIKSVLRRPETRQVKRDVEKERLARIRELEQQLLLQARENHELIHQLNLTRSELERSKNKVAAYERQDAEH